MLNSKTSRLVLALGLGATLGACEAIDHGIWAEGDPALPGDEGGQESICGESVDWQDVEVAVPPAPFADDFVTAYGPSTGNLHYDVLEPGGPGVLLSNKRMCSGTLIGPDLFLTAAHCLEPRPLHGLDTPQAICDRSHIDFAFQRVAVPGRDGEVDGVRMFAGHGGDAFDCLEVLEYGFDDGLDYAILRLDGAPGAVYGFRRPSVDVEPGDDLAVFQHPRTMPMVVDFGTADLASTPTWLQYGDLDTLPGSSGSGVLGVDGELVAVHVQGGCNLPHREFRNRAVPIGVISTVSPIIAGLLVDDGCVDADRDGAAVGEGCGRVDCDDDDDRVAPGLTETCDGIDNDCDGRVDEMRVEPTPCDADGPGVCARGVEQCVDGAITCVAVDEPGPEQCNGVDDDCDGEVDEEVDPLTAFIEDRCPTVGICAGGRARDVCVDGFWTCQLPPDFVADECPVNDRVCGFGRLDDSTCHDGRDNDCDGVRDEHDPITVCRDDPDFDRLGSACFASPFGRCGREGGTYACVELGEQCGVGIDCVGATFPEAERCDDVDWDCDGHIADRNDIDGDGYGDCGGRLDCDETRADVHPGAIERCDGVDDDCDGRTDEGVANRCGGCGPEPAEVCNGVDEDCDGRTDEGVTNRCGGCGAEPAEVCNGADDDCDGRVDEDTVGCGVQVACRPFHFGSGDQGTITVPFSGATDQVPLVIVEQYDTRGDDDFEYRINPVRIDRERRYDFAYEGNRNNGNATVSGRVCVLGAGGIAAARQMQAGIRGGDAPRTDRLAVQPLAGAAQHVFALVESHETGGDDDFWYRFQALADAVRPGLVMAAGRAGDRARALARLLVLYLPPTVRLERRRFVVRGGQQVNTVFDRRAGAGLPIPAVTVYDSGGDDDAAYTARCDGIGGQWQCFAEVTGAGERASIEGEFILLSGAIDVSLPN